MFQWIEKYFCVSNQKIRSFNFKVYLNRFLYLHTFLRKTPWKLFDPFIKFRLQMWRMNYLYISKSFSVFLWSIFENITGMPLRGHLLAARNVFFFGGGLHLESPMEFQVESPKNFEWSPQNEKWSPQCFSKNFRGSPQYVLWRWYWISFLGSLGPICHPHIILDTYLK